MEFEICPHCGKPKKPASLARTWEGHRYGRQALKPAVEMVICAQKPYEGKPVECIVETGAGALFIDGGRVGTDTSRGDRYNDKAPKGAQSSTCQGKWEKPWEVKPGRWPPNFCLVHSPGCQRAGTKRVKGTGTAVRHNIGISDKSIFIGQSRGPEDDVTYAAPDGLETVAAWQCSENCAARRIGEQSGISRDGTAVRHNIGHSAQANIQYAQGSKDAQMREDVTYGGQGTCARFFPQFDWAAEVAERLANSNQVRYCAKSSRSEREAGLDALPVQECGSLDGGDDSRIGQVRSDGAIQHTTGKPKARNIHSTVKPISLCTWLAKLLLAPPEYAPRRILIPFAGVMSEAIGAILAGWEEIVAIEMSEEYCTIGEARLKFWSQFNSYEEAMEATQNIQRSHRKQDAQAQSGQLKLTL